MASVVLWMSISIDGYMAGPAGELDWHMVDEELHQYFNDKIRKAGGFLNGRVNYELMAGFWPTADSDPNSTGPMQEFAGIWRDMPKVVYSRTLEHADWSTTIVSDVVPEEVQELKSNSEGDLLLGGADLVAEFFRLDLIDELALFVHPVILGAGKPLFPGLEERIGFNLIDTHVFGNGVVMLRYRRAGLQPLE